MTCRYCGSGCGDCVGEPPQKSKLLLSWKGMLREKRGDIRGGKWGERERERRGERETGRDGKREGEVNFMCRVAREQR